MYAQCILYNVFGLYNTNKVLPYKSTKKSNHIIKLVDNKYFLFLFYTLLSPIYYCGDTLN